MIKLSKQLVEQIARTNRNAQKYLKGEEITTIREIEYYKNQYYYVVNEKVVIERCENLGSRRRYIYDRVCKCRKVRA